jgi:hypothetical protein
VAPFSSTDCWTSVASRRCRPRSWFRLRARLVVNVRGHREVDFALALDRLAEVVEEDAALRVDAGCGHFQRIGRGVGLHLVGAVLLPFDEIVPRAIWRMVAVAWSMLAASTLPIGPGEMIARSSGQPRARPAHRRGDRQPAAPTGRQGSAASAEQRRSECRAGLCRRLGNLRKRPVVEPLTVHPVLNIAREPLDPVDVGALAVIGNDRDAVAGNQPLVGKTSSPLMMYLRTRLRFIARVVTFQPILRISKRARNPLFRSASSAPLPG